MPAETTHSASLAPGSRRSALTRILFVITSTHLGGAEKVLFEIATHLRRRNVAVHVCVLKDKGPYAERLEAQGIPVNSLDLKDTGGLRGAVSYLWTLPRLMACIRKVRPQIVHAFLFRANLLTRLACTVCRVPINISSIRIIEQERHYYYWIDRLTSSLVTQHLAVSEEVKRVSCQRSGIPEDRVRVIRNGIRLPTPGWAPETTSFDRPPAIKRELGLNAGSRVCGTVARLHSQKGIAYLIQAFSKLTGEFPEAELLVVGEGKERGPLQSLAAEHGVRKQVHFAGLALDPIKYLAVMDVFVLPSLYEGLPNALLEAMAWGVPVVASSVGGVPEVIQHQINGLLVAPGDAQAIAEAVRFVFTHPGEAQAMAQAARRCVEQHFSLSAMLGEYDELYEQLLQNCGRKLDAQLADGPE
ncbi:MAG: glycosyltransferase [Acidobacteriota bacterium]